LAAVTQLVLDVAVLDISMPGLSGIEVAQRIRESDMKVGVVFVTCCTDTDIRDAAFNLGLGYVVKSRLHTDLIPAIQLACAAHALFHPA
jgi:DNA-binding NarL/FixJ family response regulator